MKHYEDNCCLFLFMRTSSQKYMRIAGSNRNVLIEYDRNNKKRWCFSAISIFGLLGMFLIFYGIELYVYWLSNDM